MFIDTHAHLNFSDFKEDADKVIKRSLDSYTWMILVGSELKSSRRALDYANKYEKGVYASVGLHPININYQESLENQKVGEKEHFNFESYENLAKLSKVVAIGEAGLDYYRLDEGFDKGKQKNKQKEVFLKQLFLARQLNLPIIIHCRQAHDDILEILKDFKQDNPHLFSDNKAWGVMHCFSGDEDLAWQYFNLGLMISFTGLITFSKNWDDLIRKVPLDKVMIETDAPFMTPEPYRGERNEPMLVQYVANRIAEIRSVPLERIAEITTNNAKRLFNI
jgi:TatD DNase family protein